MKPGDLVQAQRYTGGAWSEATYLGREVEQVQAIGASYVVFHHRVRWPDGSVQEFVVGQGQKPAIRPLDAG